MILSIAPQRAIWKARLNNAFAAIYRGLHGGIYKGGEIAARWYLFGIYFLATKATYPLSH